MKGGTVQINWHDTKPVLTLDFHPTSGLLATGGADFDIKFWLITPDASQKKIPTASYQNSLSFHTSAVNAIRFSQSGEQLASGGDGGELIICKQHSTETGQTWKLLKNLSFHRKDVLDLQWSPNSVFLISGSVDNSCIIWDVNKGSYKISTASEIVNTAYVFSRKDLSRPALLLPCAGKPVVAVRFCPTAFSFRGSNSAGFFKIPHRLIFAVATLNSLYIYDTESIPPIAIFAGLHYAAITDIAWSSNGQYLAVSSQDGYCTLIECETNELGLAISPKEKSKNIVRESTNPIEEKPKVVIMDSITDDIMVDSDSSRTGVRKGEERQETSLTTSNPVSNKPARRRIIPMEIDPK